MAYPPLSVKILERESAIVGRELADNSVRDSLSLLVQGVYNPVDSEVYSHTRTTIRLCGGVSSEQHLSEFEACGLPEYLPFAQASFQTVVAPHTLESTDNPQQALSEILRVLEPEGYLLATGYDALGAMGLYRSLLNLRSSAGTQKTPRYIAPARLQRSMSAMGLRVISCNYITVTSCITPEVIKQPLRKMDKWGVPRLTRGGSVYVIVAQKRVHGMTQIPVNRFLSKRRLPIRATSPATRNNG